MKRRRETGTRPERVGAAAAGAGDGGAKRAVGATDEERAESDDGDGGGEVGVKISAGRTGDGMMYCRDGAGGVVGGAGDATGGLNVGAAGSRRRRRPRRVAGSGAVAAR